MRVQCCLLNSGSPCIHIQDAVLWETFEGENFRGLVGREHFAEKTLWNVKLIA